MSDTVETGVKERVRLVVVDDEPDLRHALAEYLARNGFEVRTAGSGAELDDVLGADDADLIILDVTMPGEDGLSVARRLRARGATPILMLTAADSVVDRIVGLEVGADDYVTKPFDSRELLARVRAILRRRGSGSSPAQPSPAPAAPPSDSPAARRLVRMGRAMLDLDAHYLLEEDGVRQELTAMEYDLLYAFAHNPNRILTRDRLLALAHNRDMEPYDRSIDVRVARIRRKVEQDPAKPQVIRTIRGMGYMFVPSRA